MNVKDKSYSTLWMDNGKIKIINQTKLPFKFEAGTPNIAQAIGLGEAIKYFKNNYNEKNKRYLKELRGYLLEK